MRKRRIKYKNRKQNVPPPTRHGDFASYSFFYDRFLVLIAEANFSYEDDSASIDSMERELFESLKQKYLQRMRQIREKSQSQESISSNESGGSSTSADSYDTISLEELTNMRNLSQIFDQVSQNNFFIHLAIT